MDELLIEQFALSCECLPLYRLPEPETALIIWVHEFINTRSRR